MTSPTFSLTDTLIRGRQFLPAAKKRDAWSQVRQNSPVVFTRTLRVLSTKCFHIIRNAERKSVTKWGTQFAVISFMPHFSCASYPGWSIQNRQIKRTYGNSVSIPKCYLLLTWMLRTEVSQISFFFFHMQILEGPFQLFTLYNTRFLHCTWNWHNTTLSFLKYSPTFIRKV